MASGWKLTTKTICNEKKLLYVASSCRPFHLTGYTSRTQALISSMRAAGILVVSITRPGYPWDRKDRLLNPVGEVSVVDDISYRHFAAPSHHKPVFVFAFQASKTIEFYARDSGVAVIHAASNHVNALPALLAARRLGLRFHYEMRGIWELTRISRFPEFASTTAFKRALELESFVAKSADRVYVISDQLGNYIVQNWNVEPSKVTLLPNCVDPDEILPSDLSSIDPNTIGYAGSLLDYEGLDLLISALALLREQDIKLKLKIVGDGEIRSELKALVQKLNLQDSVFFLGRVQPVDAREIIRSCVLVCLPRKPFEVCKIVTPIKLVESLAMGKPVIVPDLPVFRDELISEAGVVPGWFFKAGDVADLAEVLRVAFADVGLLAEKSLQARHHAVTMRNWQRYVEDIYKHLPDGEN